MSSSKLGELVTDEKAGRDAIHVAVVPVVAGQRLAPGADVALDEDKRAVPTSKRRAIGVVDPFLPEPVEEGQRFWLLLNPGSISNLRHSWSHPEFPNDDGVSAEPIGERGMAEAYLRDFAEKAGGDFAELLAELGSFSMGNSNVFRYRHVQVGDGTDDPYDGEADYDHPIWKHYKTLTGISPWDKECRGC